MRCSSSDLMDVSEKSAVKRLFISFHTPIKSLLFSFSKKNEYCFMSEASSVLSEVRSHTVKYDSGLLIY